jgi:L-alanine-DL-glutamate epimerase-like enolase superfamily enzyme
MKVTDIRTMRLAGPDPHGVGGVERTWQIELLRVDTDVGIHGLGEAGSMMGDSEAIAYCREWLIGKDPLAIRPFVRAMLYGGLPPYDPQMSPTATVVGPISWAVSGIEMALCDIAGKALGTPVYNLLGGAFRNRVRVYLDRSGVADPTDDNAWRKLAERVRSEGFTDLKFDAEWVAPELSRDPWNRSIGRDQIHKTVERLALVRDVVGADIEIALDGHMSYDVDSAVRLARALEPIGLSWFEDPIPILDVDGLARVREASRIPICAGEMFVTEQFRTFIDRGALDIAHPDVLFVGGLHEARTVADLADLHSIPLALHNNGSALTSIGAAHVAASSPNFIALEYHFYDAPWIGRVIRREGHELFEGGHVVLSDAPGLGIELDLEVCRQYLAPGESLF